MFTYSILKSHLKSSPPFDSANQKMHLNFHSLQNVQILTALRLRNIAKADFLQNFLCQMQRNLSPRISHFTRSSSGCDFFVTLLLQTDLLEDADEQLVNVVLDSGRSFDELGATAFGQCGAFCGMQIGERRKREYCVR